VQAAAGQPEALQCRHESDCSSVWLPTSTWLPIPTLLPLPFSHWGAQAWPLPSPPPSPSRRATAPRARRRSPTSVALHAVEALAFHTAAQSTLIMNDLHTACVHAGQQNVHSKSVLILRYIIVAVPHSAESSGSCACGLQRCLQPSPAL
jgi:hypothetical protein